MKYITPKNGAMTMPIHIESSGRLKARPAMIDKLRELSTSLYPSKPQLVVKHALPTAFRLLEDNRADLRTGTVQLLRMLHVLLGPQLFEHAQRAPSAVQSRLADVIQTL